MKTVARHTAHYCMSRHRTGRVTVFMDKKKYKNTRYRNK